jgi:hypothetical protein
MSPARRPRPVVVLARLAVALVVAAAATGCGSDSASPGPEGHAPEAVAAAFEQAGLPVVEPVEETVSCDDLFRDADDLGARTGEFRCVALEAVPFYPDAVRFLPSESKDFVADVFETEAGASEAAALPLDPEAFEGRQPVVLREANVVVIVVADEARRAEIQAVLDGL